VERQYRVEVIEENSVEYWAQPERLK